MMILKDIPDLELKNKSFEGGEKLPDRDTFQFVTLIGSGAFGKVYRATSKKTGKNYAVKILTKNQIASLKLADQLRNEISILARCDHENIIKLHAAYEDSSFVSLVLELASSGSLFKKLQAAKQFSEAQTARILADVIRAIYYLHSLNPPVLHRDLKPENVLISEDLYKIADFGWSNVNDDSRNTFCGTPDYLAPEMIRGDGHNDRLDVWTIGVLMFELLHGKPPFSPKEKQLDKRMAQRMIERNVLEGRIDFDPKVSKVAEDCIRTLLNPDSKARPAAKDIFDLEFFKVHGQTLERKILNTEGFSSETSDPTSMSRLLNEYKEKLQRLASVNETMNELMKSKDQKIEQMQKEIDTLKSETKNTDFKHLPRDNESLLPELARSREEVAKMQQTITYLYTRAKELTRYISNFCLRNVDEEALKQTSDNTLSYESTFEKLRILFRNFIEYKCIAKGMPKPVLSDHDFSYTPAKIDRSRSPAPASKHQLYTSRDNGQSAKINSEFPPSRTPERQRTGAPSNEEIEKFLK